MDHEMLVNLGLSKYKVFKEEPKKFFVRSVVAGLYLGVATILSYTLGALLFENHPTFAKIALAGTFGIGLAAISLLGSELFTGNCFVTIMPVFDKQIKFVKILPMWLVCYLGNFVGIFLVCFLFVKSGVNSVILTEYIKDVMHHKMDFDAVQLFIKGILCNFTVCVAAYAGIKLKNEVAKIIMYLVIVMAFVLPGFDHSIANMGSITIGFAELGSRLPMNWVPLHMLLTTLGNIVGGAFLLGWPIYTINRPKITKKAYQK
ncbi:MAG: formate/nitrite transporter family protein [Coprobacillaceae bacterium]